MEGWLAGWMEECTGSSDKPPTPPHLSLPLSLSLSLSPLLSLYLSPSFIAHLVPSLPTSVPHPLYASKYSRDDPHFGGAHALRKQRGPPINHLPPRPYQRRCFYSHSFTFASPRDSSGPLIPSSRYFYSLSLPHPPASSQHNQRDPQYHRGCMRPAHPNPGECGDSVWVCGCHLRRRLEALPTFHSWVLWWERASRRRSLCRSRSAACLALLIADRWVERADARLDPLLLFPPLPPLPPHANSQPPLELPSPTGTLRGHSVSQPSGSRLGR